MAKVVQINLHHAKAASYALCKHMVENNIDIALVQEPWVVNGRITGLGDSKGWIISDPLDEKPRTCVIIRNNVKFTPLTNFCSRDLVVIKTTINVGGGEREILLGSAYLPYDQNPPPTGELKKVVTFAQNKRWEILLGCDANAHHIIWGSSNINTRGELLLQYLIANNIGICNEGNEPTFFNKTREEVIDITMGTPLACNMVTAWQVSDEISHSDHRYIRFNIEVVKETVKEYRNPRNTDWELYKELLEEGLRDCPARARNSAELVVMEEYLRMTIMNAFNNSCPVKVPRTSKNVPWWHEGLERLRRESRRSYNKAKCTGEWESYRHTLTEYNKAIRKAKRDSWRRYCEEIERLPEGARLQKALQKGKPIKIGSLKRHDGKYTDSGEESLRTLLQTHFPGSVAIRNQSEQTSQINLGPTERAQRENWKFAEKVIDQTKIKWAIKSFKPFKSPGRDGIFPALLQQGNDMLASPLCTLLRASLAIGYLPDIWREVQVVFIPKPGKETYTQAKSFRPISLTSFILKVLEKLVERYIRDEVLNKIPLFTNQCAYQAGKSCELAIHKVVTKIENTLRSKETALGTFIDIEGAFDNTSMESIAKAAKRRGIHPVVCRWITNMLQSRKIFASLNQEIASIRATRGCPQGGYYHLSCGAWWWTICSGL